jgi:hypothetical protein
MSTQSQEIQSDITPSSTREEDIASTDNKDSDSISNAEPTREETPQQTSNDSSKVKPARKSWNEMEEEDSDEDEDDDNVLEDVCTTVSQDDCMDAYEHACMTFPKEVREAVYEDFCAAASQNSCAVSAPKAEMSSELSEEHISRLVRFLRPYARGKHFIYQKNIGRDLHDNTELLGDIPDFHSAALVSHDGITCELAKKYYGNRPTALEKAGLSRMVKAQPRNGRPGQFTYSIERIQWKKKNKNKDSKS